MENPIGTIVELTGNGEAGDGTPRFVASTKPNRPITFHTSSMTIAAVLLTLLMASCCDCSRSQQTAYIDAHSHTNGILPYYAYADLQKFVDYPDDPSKVDIEARCRLWKEITKIKFPVELKKLGPDNRYAPGARATIEEYKDLDCDNAAQHGDQINGALERVLTTTPWTEFDSAYQFRGDAVDKFVTREYPNSDALICEATIIRLAQTKIVYSEQFLNFILGWKPGRLENIRCLLREPQTLKANGKLKAHGWPTPVVKILLMTSTSELGATADGRHWMQFGETGTCNETTREPLVTDPEIIRNALLGRDKDGKRTITAEEERTYFDGVLGTDTAGPEITCFTSADEAGGSGMENFKRLVRAVYSASRERRGAGWHGKLLVHTHVGEGFVTFPPEPVQEVQPKSKNVSKVAKTGKVTSDTFQMLAKVPKDEITNIPIHVSPARKNITILLKAVRELKSEIPDLDDFVILRFGHVTHADWHDAQEMKALKVEADINLESNLATRVYDSPAIVVPAKLSEAEQFKYNDFPARALETDPAKVLVNHSLKFMLEAGVRTLLGTDGGGEEHSDIAREYELTGKLIDYWKANDPDFRSRVPSGMSIKVIYQNGEAHLKDLKEDKKVD